MKVVPRIVLVIVVLLPFPYRIYDAKIMRATGLLIVSNISTANNLLERAFQHVNRRLYIAFKPSDKVQLNTHILSKHLTSIYTQSTILSEKIDVRILLQNVKSPMETIQTTHPIELVLFNKKDLIADMNNVVKNISNLLPNYNILNVDADENTSHNQRDHSIEEVVEKRYKNVAVGGTFDRLHNGHKILLSEAILRSTKHLTVGVTDTNMIKSKKLWELIERVESRVQNVQHFLHDVNPYLDYRVIPIQDMYGPTKDDPNLQLLVVSEETRRGGDLVNVKRKENNLLHMDVHCISLAIDDNPGLRYLEEAKISSSNTRLRLLGTILKEPEPKPHLPKHPYIIGLSGGIATGKTNITKYLRELGAGIVNCDLLGHEVYKPGQPMNATIARTFGHSIINENGEVNRKKLGEIVFNDKSQLDVLNNLMWPEIIKLAMQQAQELYKEGYCVVVLEAAILIPAGWKSYCHQVWSTIISPDEAVKRLSERNNLSEAHARERIASQPSNEEQVAVSNIVLSSLGEYEFTRQQVEKAWAALQKYL